MVGGKPADWTKRWNLLFSLKLETPLTFSCISRRLFVARKLSLRYVVSSRDTKPQKLQIGSFCPWSDNCLVSAWYESWEIFVTPDCENPCVHHYHRHILCTLGKKATCWSVMEYHEEMRYEFQRGLLFLFLSSNHPECLEQRAVKLDGFLLFERENLPFVMVSREWCSAEIGILTTFIFWLIMVAWSWYTTHMHTMLHVHIQTTHDFKWFNFWNSQQSEIQWPWVRETHFHTWLV